MLFEMTLETKTKNGDGLVHKYHTFCKLVYHSHNKWNSGRITVGFNMLPLKIQRCCGIVGYEIHEQFYFRTIIYVLVHTDSTLRASCSVR